MSDPVNHPNEPAVFAWLSGQADNIGDSMLRRAYAQALAACGRVEAWVGNPDSGYASGLGLSRDSMNSGYFRWVGRFARSAWSGSAVFAFNAGEFVPTKKYVAGLIFMLPVIALHRLRGGRIVWMGAGVRRGHRLLMHPFRLLARWSDPLRFRDVESTRIVGMGKTMPDWGFALGTGGALVVGAPIEPAGANTPRDYIAVVLRGDRRPPSDSWVAAVERLAARTNTKVVVVVQVERDRAAAEALGARLDCRIIRWNPSVDHRQQEARVRAEYGRCRAVISDRLHALIMGATEGAVPLGWCETATDKVSRHFELIDADWLRPPGDGPTEALDALTPDALETMRIETLSAVARARAELREAADSLVRRVVVDA
ncbi:hypothetical protein GE115_11225 [Agromyces sp. CFH 90414]|uniref:Polysaccharide pyruvyl transferase domain-containing protein n=1 Tax=Agromyces agglutinans TaxID=2662258 RepID=A0A6I2F6R3_9MICO|nr:polysaccharide pyruvyl transferase family protein [Agromyces agglutinans]MRG60432.1 hypothetical protein [Agromyces agglutinans]